MKKELFRSQSDRILTGVLGGISEYFSLNSNFVRIIAVIILFTTEWIFILYIILWLALPKTKLTKNIKKTSITDFFDNIEKKIKANIKK